MSLDTGISQIDLQILRNLFGMNLSLNQTIFLHFASFIM